MPIRYCSAAIIALLLALSTPGATQTASPADVLYREAVRLYKAGQYQEALDFFLKAKAEGSSPKIEFNIGVTRQALGQLPEAAQQFEKAKSLSSSLNDAQGVAVAEQRLQALRGALGCVTVLSPSDGVSILVDGERRGTTPLATSLYLRPGMHRLTATQRGAPPYIVELELAAGELKRVTLPSRSAPMTQSASRAVASLAPSPDERLAKQGEQQAKERRAKTRWGYAALGVAGAFLATSAVLFGVGGSAGKSAKDEYMDTRRDDPTNTGKMVAARDDVAAARTKLIVADVLAGVGAAALGASLYLLLTRPEARPRDGAAARHSAERPSARIWATPAGLGVSGSF